MRRLSGGKVLVRRQAVRQAYCRTMAQLAVKALLYEVCIAPKPGLVDRYNNGSHQDMNLYTFLDSACALAGYFEDITAEGMRLRSLSPGQLLPHLQQVGLLAERNMFAATQGINTHKGIVFSMGIFCAACGYWYERSGPLSVAELLSLCGEIAGAPSRGESSPPSTNGERLYHKYRIQGVRGEAAQGFPSVQRHGLPAFRHAMQCGWGMDAAGVYALLHIMANLEDTNIISRSNLKTQEQLRRTLAAFLQQPGLSEDKILEQAAQMDKECIAQNISPGGAADMLSITLLLWFLQTTWPERFGE